MLNKLFSIIFRKTNKHNIINLFGLKIKFRLSHKEYINLQRTNGNRYILHKLDGSMEEFPRIKNLEVLFEGRNSLVELWEPYNFKEMSFSPKTSIRLLGDNHIVKIKNTIHSINGLEVSLTGNNNELFIDENLYLSFKAIIEFGHSSNLKIKIGKNCMIAKDVHIMASDFHTIFSNSDKTKVLNKPNKGITIGNHVWIARNALILKDVDIANGVIIGMNSVITKSFNKENTIIAGNPAKIVKEDVNWDIQNPDIYSKTLTNSSPNQNAIFREQDS